MAPELRGSWLERRQGSPMRTTSSPHRELTRCGRGKQRTKADLSRSKAVRDSANRASVTQQLTL
jgi:hypothetical protein